MILFILAGAGPRPDVRDTTTAAHVYIIVQHAFDFVQPGVLILLIVTYLSRKTHDALEFGRPGVQNALTAAH